MKVKTSHPEIITVNQDSLFFTAYVLLFLYDMLLIYTNLGDLFGNIADYVTQLIYISFLLVCGVNLIFYRRYSVRELLFIALLLVLGFATYLFSGNNELFNLIAIVSVAKGVDFEKFLRKLLIFSIVFLVVVIGLACTNLISSSVTTRTDNGQLRRDLGFHHPNTLGLFVFQIIACIILLEGKNLKIIHCFLLLGAELVFYLITKSQTSLISTLLLIAAFMLYKFIARTTLTTRQTKRLVSFVIVVCFAALAVIVCYFWKNPSSMPYRTVRSRINLAGKYLNAYGINLFGHDIITGSNVALPGYDPGYSYLDNSQMRMLIEFGIAGFVIFFYIYLRSLVNMVKKGELLTFIVASVYLVYSLLESAVCRVSFDFILVYAAINLYEKHSPGISTFSGFPKFIKKDENAEINSGEENG